MDSVNTPFSDTWILTKKIESYKEKTKKWLPKLFDVRSIVVWPSVVVLCVLASYLSDERRP